MRELNGKRLHGPYRPTKTAALDAWKDKQSQSRAKPPKEDHETTLGAEYYWLLFGVHSATEKPTTKGIWWDELAPTTYQLYKDVFRAYVANDPIAWMYPEGIDPSHLEAFRTRILRSRSFYLRTKPDGTKEKVYRKPPNPRSVDRYMVPVVKVLHRFGNRSDEHLGKLKKPPVAKSWLPRSERDELLGKLTGELRLGALMMLHGMCIGEVCEATADNLEGNCLRIESQLSEIGGKAVSRKELKRPRRYRLIPVSDELRRLIKGKQGRLVTYLPNNFRRDFRKALKGTKWEGLTPHDLRRSGGKWMLDAGAKLSDVAAILGNDPKTLLAWYDTADREGMARAILAV